MIGDRELVFRSGIAGNGDGGAYAVARGGEGRIGRGFLSRYRGLKAKARPRRFAEQHLLAIRFLTTLHIEEEPLCIRDIVPEFAIDRIAFTVSAIAAGGIRDPIGQDPLLISIAAEGDPVVFDLRDAHLLR